MGIKILNDELDRLSEMAFIMTKSIYDIFTNNEFKSFLDSSEKMSLIPIIENKHKNKNFGSVQCSYTKIQITNSSISTDSDKHT